MGSSFLCRVITVAVAAGVSVAGLAVPARAASDRVAASVRIDDAVGDAFGVGSAPIDEPRADLTSGRAVIHGDGRIELTAAVVERTDPSTDAGWVGGGSLVMWVLDTNRDGTADYVVGHGNGVDGPVLVVHADTFAPVEGCSPTVEDTATRYGLVLPPICLGSPSTFRWNVVMHYDADPADDRDGATDSAPGGMDDLTAEPGSVTDPTGDVTTEQTISDARGDITTAGAAYETDAITLTASLAVPTDPRTDAGWAGGSGLVWLLDTDAEPDLDYSVHRTGPGLGFVVTDRALTELCRGEAEYGPSGYTVRFDPACIGSPPAFSWGVVMAYDEAHTGVYDLAPDTPGPAGPVNAPDRPGDPGPDPGVRTSGGGSGYWMITDGGDVYGFGDARHYGNDAGPATRADIEPTHSGAGYWILATNGAVSPKGDARPLGDATGRLQPGESAAALSATPSGDGYWIFTDRGRVLAFGDAPFLGDLTGVVLNGAILDSVATPTGAGYWMVGSDGGIFTFGDATFSGSTGDIKLNRPVMSMAADPDGKGYWLVASDGGIFAFDAPFYGSMGATPLNRPVSGIVPGSAGYLMVAEDGGIFSFGNVAFHGSLGASPPARPVVAVALAP